jgi:hypothetical protein
MKLKGKLKISGSKTDTNMYESCSNETQLGNVLVEGLEAVRNNLQEQCGWHSTDNPGNRSCPQ